MPKIFPLSFANCLTERYSVARCRKSRIFKRMLLRRHLIHENVFEVKLEGRMTGSILNWWKKSFLPPWTLGRVRFFSLKFETGRPASSDSRNRSQDLLERVWGQFYYFSFMFILTESLENYSKLQKNIKYKKLILLDSIWVDIRSEHIIWYTLVYYFTIYLDIYFFVINL